MRYVASILFAALLALIFQTPGSAAAVKKVKTKPAQGSVEAVEKNVLTVKVAPGKKRGGEATEKKFKLNSDTKYERVSKVKGQKGQTETKEAKFEDIAAGEHVVIHFKGDTAEKVVMMGKAKKKT